MRLFILSVLFTSTSLVIAAGNGAADSATDKTANKTASSTHKIESNAITIADAPKWLTRVRVDKIVDRMQTKLEWSIHRVTGVWHKDLDSFTKAHSLGPYAIAVSRKNDNTIHFSPKITSENFDGVFGHELVHIIIFQKYNQKSNTAIPPWLEEGLANHLAKGAKVKYNLLSQRPPPADVHELTHPSRGTREDIHYKYQASQALAEMISSKCDLTNLLRLSVGESLDAYLGTYCEIKNLNEAFAKWIEKKSKPQ